MPPKDPDGPDRESSDGFASTSWSLVIEAGRGEDGGRALDRLCRKHWRPIFIFIRKSGLSQADAEDATQEFFADFLERDWLSKADPARGSFRSFLLTLVTNFIANRRRVGQAQRRGGGVTFVSFADSEREAEFSRLAGGDGDPSQAYLVSWAHGVLGAAWERLGQEQAEAGSAAVFEALRDFVTQAPTAGDYQRLGEKLGMRRGHVALTVHRLNRRFTELIRAEVAETLVDRSDLDAELRTLLAAIAR